MLGVIKNTHKNVGVNPLLETAPSGATESGEYNEYKKGKKKKLATG